MKRLLLLAGAVVLMGISGVLLLTYSNAAAPPFLKPGAPNGYNSFIDAAKAIQGPVPEGTNGLPTFIAGNDRVFALVDTGLMLPSELPQSLYNESLVQSLGGLKTLANTLRAKGAEAERRGKLVDATTNYLQIIQVGQKLEHGPLICLLLGLSVERTGLTALEALGPKLSATERNQVKLDLHDFNRRRIAFAEVKARENYFMRQSARNPLMVIVAKFLTRKPVASAAQKRETLAREFVSVASKIASE